MTILVINGSPRKGCTDFMLDIVLKEIKADKELILLRNKDIKHCTGCLQGYKKKECAIKDDMQELNKKLSESNIIIIGTPNYFDSVPGLLKDFIDRTNPFYKTCALKGKKVYALAVGGMSKEHSVKAVSTINTFAKAHEMDFELGPIYEFSEDKKIEDDKAFIGELKEFGRRIR